jgi:hypothetical protein
MNTVISEKIREKEQKKGITSKSDNWYGFAYLSLFAFILVLFIGILGANFIYITNLNPGSLDMLFPSEESNYFDENVLKGGAGMTSTGMTSAGMTSAALSPDYNCNIKSKIGSFSKLMSILPSKEFPYSLKQKSHVTDSILQKIKNWFALTCAESFMVSRGILKTWLNLFSKKSILGNDIIQMLFIAPLNLGVGTSCAFLLGLASTLMALYNTGGMVGFIMGFIFMYNFAFMTTISVLQSMLFSFTFLFLPLIIDFKKVLNILHCNISTLSTLFGLLTCITALFSFDITSASIYIIAFIMINIISFFTSAAA